MIVHFKEGYEQLEAFESIISLLINIKSLIIARTSRSILKQYQSQEGVPGDSPSISDRTSSSTKWQSSSGVRVSPKKHFLRA
ncbi:MAG: hypothetical protein KME60_29375 [Cyanomargarita calcarea GSE-NOS-MK-12-04C]|jgi:hypothetical protein|uniref:Uncharacterized protein n=1 Tax=Cyanomargarita calcarea GSE-NOS-MK-12-04C TaxID=2839659 RepID=A0A951QV84_9CYAN|nr:hypothetical protein [Cyanomargarita calcarea GSE-NOS-MK-12-04C]